MGQRKYEYMSDFAREYVAQGKAEGKAEGKTEGSAIVIRRLITARFGPLAAETEARITAASADELSDIAVSILTATTLEQVFADIRSPALPSASLSTAV